MYTIIKETAGAEITYSVVDMQDYTEYGTYEYIEDAIAKKESLEKVIPF